MSDEHDRGHTHGIGKAAFIAQLQALGYSVDMQTEITSTMLGVILTLATQNAALEKRLLKIENRQPSSFKG